MVISKVVIYKIHTENFHILGLKAVLRDVFFKHLQARY